MPPLLDPLLHLPHRPLPLQVASLTRPLRPHLPFPWTSLPTLPASSPFPLPLRKATKPNPWGAFTTVSNVTVILVPSYYLVLNKKKKKKKKKKSSPPPY
jgi:hypothetical protein